MSLEFSALRTHASSWEPRSCKVTLNCRLEGRIVPSDSSAAGARLDAANLVVLDDFFGEAESTGLLEALTGTEHDLRQGPPSQQWERNTADDATAAKTWGLRDDSLAALAGDPPRAMLEIQTRLVKMYPQYKLVHMPSAEMQQSAAKQHIDERSASPTSHKLGLGSGASKPSSSNRDSEQLETSGGEVGDDEVEDSGVDCCNLLANAPVHGDHYEWHVDADPLTLPDCEWRRHFGDFCNREPGMPLLVSLLLYLVDDGWERNMHAETLFLDSATDVGIVVRPRRFRAVLMDQDVLHRVVAPSRLAGQQPRYSLVWKLAFLPRQPGQACSIALPEWGPPVNLGSASRLEQVKRAVSGAQKRKRLQET